MFGNGGTITSNLSHSNESVKVKGNVCDGLKLPASVWTRSGPEFSDIDLREIGEKFVQRSVRSDQHGFGKDGGVVG